MTQEREAFEAWLNPANHPGNVSAWVEPGRYEKDTHSLAWLAWSARASLAQPASAPSGWKLVPVEMTPEMQQAFDDCSYKCITEASKYWAATLAAAPQAPQPAQAAEAIRVEAVATVKIGEDGEPYLRWHVEGGIYALPEDVTLVFPHQDITDDDGSGEVYLAPPTEAATIAGLESAGGHLAALVDEAQVLLTELREYARDLEKETLGGESERGEVSLLDRVDDWLDARPVAPSAQAEPIAALVAESERLGLYDVPPLAELRDKLGGWDVPEVSGKQAEQGGK